jgi:mannose/fructose/N-acetylgalactosamine-specific phosphotransferase system component IID
MKPIISAAVRLLVIQGSWTYERLQGVGVGFASLPLLEPLRRDPDRHRAALARSAEYFNAHPYLTGIAVGAAAKAELDGVGGATVQRLKTALAGPLGSLGDQLFWIGVVPIFMGATLLSISVGGGLTAVALTLGLYLTIRVATGVWGLRLGLRSGVGVAAELRRSGLAEMVRGVGLLAGLVVATAVPIVTGWLSRDLSGSAIAAVIVGLVGGTLAALARFRVVSSRLLTLIAAIAAIIWSGSTR